jgi:hypothetical protein
MLDDQAEEELAKCRFRHLKGIPNPVFKKITGFFYFSADTTEEQGVEHPEFQAGLYSKLGSPNNNQ